MNFTGPGVITPTALRGQRGVTGQNNVRTSKKRKSKKTCRRGKRSNRIRVRFSNVIETICPTDSSDFDDSSSDDGNIASGEDNVGLTRTRLNKNEGDGVSLAHVSGRQGVGRVNASNVGVQTVSSDRGGVHLVVNNLEVSCKLMQTMFR